jgi:hypothetical protein
VTGRRSEQWLREAPSQPYPYVFADGEASRTLGTVLQPATAPHAMEGGDVVVRLRLTATLTSSPPLR